MREDISAGAPVGKGYVAAWLGAMVGAVLVVIPAGLMGTGLVEVLSPTIEDAELLGLVLGFAVGAIIGETYGAWFALRLRNHGGRRTTAIVLALLLFVPAVAAIAGSASTASTGIDLFVPGCVVGPLLARRIRADRGRTARSKRWRRL